MFNKTETRVLNTLSIELTDHDAISKVIKGEFTEAQTALLPILATLGFSISDVQATLKTKLAKVHGTGITGYKYVMGKSKVGIFPIMENGEVKKYGDWISLTTFKAIMAIDTLPTMEQYVSKREA